MPGDKFEVEKESSLLNVPSTLELHLHPVIEPSESLPCPVKVTVSPSVAGLGVMESISAVGGLLTPYGTRVHRTASAQVLEVLATEVTLTSYLTPAVKA